MLPFNNLKELINPFDQEAADILKKISAPKEVIDIDSVKMPDWMPVHSVNVEETEYTPDQKEQEIMNYFDPENEDIRSEFLQQHFEEEETELPRQPRRINMPYIEPQEPSEEVAEVLPPQPEEPSQLPRIAALEEEQDPDTRTREQKRADYIEEMRQYHLDGVNPFMGTDLVPKDKIFGKDDKIIDKIWVEEVKKQENFHKF